MYEFKAKERPRWYQFRLKLSNAFVWLARKVHPRNPEVYAFTTELMMDAMITGRSIVRVDPCSPEADMLNENYIVTESRP